MQRILLKKYRTAFFEQLDVLGFSEIILVHVLKFFRRLSWEARHRIQ